jgi:hypothetical protein
VVNEARHGARSWLFTWTSKGKRREMGLGSYGNEGGRVSLSRALWGKFQHGTLEVQNPCFFAVQITWAAQGMRFHG